MDQENSSVPLNTSNEYQRDSLFLYKHPNEIPERAEEHMSSNNNSITNKFLSDLNIRDKIEQESTNVKTVIKDQNNIVSPLLFPEKNIFSAHQSNDQLDVNINSSLFNRNSKKRTKTLFKKSKTTICDVDIEIPENNTNKFKNFIISVLDSNIELFIMALLTCFALFGSDLKSIALNPKYDDYFNIIYIIVLASFLLEFIISWYVKPGYILTFFGILDLLSIISMFIEIDWFLKPIVDTLIL
jgi:hypothetical protein